MKTEMKQINSFNEDAQKLFNDKGIGNAEKVRRIMQLTHDLASKKFSDLTILDLGCGEGVYSLEAGIRGARVTGMDGRDNRLRFGKEVALNHGLDNVNFIVDDVRNLTFEKYGTFDVVYLLGLLYHLDEPEIFDILKNIYSVCGELLIIDTAIALSTPITLVHEKKEYYGVKYIEHEEGDSEDLMINKRIMASIGNNKSFAFSKKSLIKYLNELGFNTVLECYAPIENNKTESRITLVAIKSEKEKIASYPWLNDMTEKEISNKLKSTLVIPPFALKHQYTFKAKVKMFIDKWLAKRGYELKIKLKDQ